MLATVETGDQKLIRKHNMRLVLDALRRNPSLSRADVAALLGLTRATTTKIINPSIGENLLNETTHKTNATGRPGLSVELNPNFCCAVGIDLATDTLSVVLTNFMADILWQRQVPLGHHETQDQVMLKIQRMTQQALDHAESIHLRCHGIGVALSGLVNYRQGILKNSPNLHLRNMPVQQIMSEKFQLPVITENSGVGAALTDYLYGTRNQPSCLICIVSSGWGLGAGIVVDGRIYRGESGYCGEVGHTLVDSNGDMCTCGRRGCLETGAAPRRVVERFRKRIADGTQSAALELAGGKPESITYHHLVEAARAGDVEALRIFAETGYYLGQGIANLLVLLNPRKIVFGAMLAEAAEFMIPTIQEYLRSTPLLSEYEIELGVSLHGVNARSVGAASLILYSVLQDPDQVRGVA